MTGLRISPDLELPLDAVTQTFAILAKRGAGKTNAGVVMAEEMLAAGIPWVALDPVGSWWGIRADGDGGPGLPVVVLGGEHGDLPLEPTAGTVLADMVIDQRGAMPWVVFDMSELSDGDVRRFATAFLRQLYRRNREPLHLFFEEAEVILPQQVRAHDAPMVGAVQKLIKLGRGRGLGCTLITQRSASVNKDGLTQVETLIAMRTTGPQDRAAILSWVKDHEAGADAVASLPDLPAGEAYVFSPGWIGELTRVTFRRRRTFDSGATPELGQPIRPVTMAELDLGAIKDAMAATIEKAQAEDPRALRARIRELERELAGQAPPAELQEAERRIGLLEGALAGAGCAVANVTNLLTEITALLVEWSGAEPPVAAKEGGAVQPGPSAARSSPTPGDRTVPGTAITEEKPIRSAGDAPRGPAGLGKAERAILTAVVRKPDSSPTVIAFLARYSPRSSSFQNALGSLRSRSLLARGTPLRPLGGAVEALGGVEPLPTGEELRRFWLNRLGRAERAILEVLLDRYPRSISREELAEASGYSATSSSFQNALGKLRGLGLCVRRELQATGELMEALDG